VTFLVDTNIISKLSRRSPDHGVLAWAGGVTQLAVSVISVEEVFFGLAWRPNPRVLYWMEAFFQRHEVLMISEAIARRVVREQADMLIAATAQAHQLTLVTRNTKDFENCGIGLLSPFSDTGS